MDKDLRNSAPDTGNKRNRASKIQAIDLFCGTGGLTHGLVRGGIKVIAGVDVDPTCRFAYEANNPAQFIEKSVRDLHGDDINALFDRAEVRLLAGCAPCQPFSTYSRKKRIGLDAHPDPKWNLLSDFGRLIQEAQPDLVTMENVPQLPDDPIFETFLSSLDGYSTTWKVIECSKYGIPQTRKRLVLLASKFGLVHLTEPRPPSRPTTVREAIGNLPKIDAGTCDPHDELHRSSALSEINLKRIRASVPGGTWRDWDERLLSECHRKESGKTYPSVYGRMRFDSPSPTITTQFFGYGNGRFGHPEQDRAISLREAAMLQTFPADYRFIAPGDKVRFSSLGRLIGNAVPVRLAEVIAESLIEHVTESQGRRIGNRTN